MTAAGKVLLVNPRITSRSKARFPLSLLAIASRLGSEYSARIIDGNKEDDCVAAALQAIEAERYDAVGVTVMGGPQVETAIALSKAIKANAPSLPIVWGGYFPTLYPDAALNAPYVDYLIRGQGEEILWELLQAQRDDRSMSLEHIDGLSWKRQERAVHNRERRFSPTFASDRLPYELLGDPREYFVRTFLGQRTVAHQAALGCRFRCTFCGVAAMFRGGTALPLAAKLERDLQFLRQLGADSVQFCDHNFFDREEDMVPLLEVLAKMQMPWWCYARADALLDLSAASWDLVRKSRLRMAYIGAESPNDQLLKEIRKGTRSDQTLAVAELCRAHDVIPELSFMVAPPHDPEGETERTFEFIRQVKRINPRAEIIVYIYTPLPVSSVPENMRSKIVTPLRDLSGNALQFPATPEEWTQRRWVDYACHADAPWISRRLRRRIQDFVTVLGCRFPTVQDVRFPPWTKTTLRALASWRYRFRKYDRPWELHLSKSLVRLADPRASSL
jgi:anaerobic magnesium-protoporphyrin IX monomethyl ester cyclase